MSSIVRDLLSCNFSQLLSAWRPESKSLCTTLLFGDGIGLLSVARFAWSDYKVYMGYGPGGIPYNMYGWFFSSCILRSMITNVFSTAHYDKLPDKRSWLGVNWPGGRTRGPQRPKLGPHPLPQRQLNQLATPEIHMNLVKAFDAVVAANSNLIQFQPSNHEGHTNAIFVADSITKSSIVDQTLGEVSHIHGTGDHSVHVVLAPQECEKVINWSWGQRHPLDGVSAVKYIFGWTIPKNYVLVYAPRTDKEIEVVMEIVKASIGFMTGSQEVRA